MSCVLRIRAEDLDGVLRILSLEPYRVEQGVAHFQASQRDFDDLPGQVQEAMAFLSANETGLRMALATAGADGVLDFAVEVAAASFGSARFPPGLVRQAGSLGLALEVSHYPRDGVS